MMDEFMPATIAEDIFDNMANKLGDLDYRTAVLACALSSFRNNYAEFLHATKPNNWLRRHRLPMRRRKCARWIEDEYAYNHCSICSFEFDWPEQTEPVCPQCGARMKRKEVQEWNDSKVLEPREA